MREGTDSLRSRPRPAVRLSPRKTTRGRAGTGTVGAEDTGANSARSSRDSGAADSLLPHAVHTASTPTQRNTRTVVITLPLLSITDMDTLSVDPGSLGS